MKTNGFILRGNIVYATDTKTLIEMSHGYLVCEDNLVAGVFENIPEVYCNYPVTDYGDNLIMPGLVDLHVHAPQYAFRGIGMDLELLPWLQTYTFPEERKYGNKEYAITAYDKFARDFLDGYTTRAVVFSTMHREGTTILMDALEATGLKTYVGKVNMDRNSIEGLTETTEGSIADTRAWLDGCGEYQNVKPILTPRFIPSCTNTLMEALSDIQQEYHLPVQSHLSENASEIAWVKELHPDTSCYGGVYDKYHLFGQDVPTVMAHCVHCVPEELDLIEKNGVFIAHCPESNMNLSSGVAPVRHFIDRNLKVGLGSDVAGGAHGSLFAAMAYAIQASKMRWALKDDSLAPLTTTEAFYLATKGGGEYFGKVGSFEPGYACDAIVIDDAVFETAPGYNTLAKRLERIIYLADECQLKAKYVEGNRVK